MKEQDRRRTGLTKADEASRIPANPNSKERSGTVQNSVFGLQRTVGNQAVASLFGSGAIQAKLRVSQPEDADELEADRIADQVVGTGTPSTVASSASDGIHRKCDCPGGIASCPACEEEEVEQAKGIHRKSSQTSQEELSVRDDFLQSLGPGQALDPAVRDAMESRFGRNFEDVRVHSDSPAADAADSIDATAYTHKNHIYFAAGKYDPATPRGEHLLAHELTHTVQQGAPSSYRTHKPENSNLRASPDIQRQVAGAPDPNKFNRCKDLLGEIKAAVAELLQRAADLLNDPLGLQWDNWNVPKILPDGTNIGSVVGHQHQYEGWRNRLENLIEEWDNDDCNSTGLRVPKDARDLQFKPAPSPIPRPRPETGPKPWTAPGRAPSDSPTARRLSAAAKGAAIGATAGLVLGGIAGAIGGGAGGTLVAPGVGTVGGGVAGAMAGAEAGAPIGAALGASIGGLIGWIPED